MAKRQKEKLSPLTVQRLTTPGFYSDGAGIYLRVSDSGTKSWSFRYKIKDIVPKKFKEHEMGLGPYPLRSLAEARTEALKARKLLLDGLDPIKEKRKLKHKRALDNAKGITFDECAKAYIEQNKSSWSNAKHAAQWVSTLETYVSPKLGKLSVRDIDTGLVMSAIEPIWKKVPETAARVRNRIKIILDWAKVRGYREGENPARWEGHLNTLLPKRSKIKLHFAALPFTEIPEFMIELKAEQGIAPKALEFTILTAARSGEVRGAKWEEIDFETNTWTIPAERMKAKLEHRVPLAARVVEILESLKGKKDTGLIFHGHVADTPLSDMSLTAVLRRMKREVTTHGFRSTFRDWAGDCTNFPREVCEAALAHSVGNKVEEAYRRGNSFEKRKKLMEAWTSYCSLPPTKGSVIGINKSRAQEVSR